MFWRPTSNPNINSPSNHIAETKEQEQNSKQKEQQRKKAYEEYNRATHEC
jgi:ABC-type transporter lipoprotein component MlaA